MLGREDAERLVYIRHLIRKEVQMIHADIQTQLDRITAVLADIPTQVTKAVANAEAAKDTDHADDVAAITKAVDALTSTVSDIAATTSQATPAPVTTTAPADTAPALVPLAPALTPAA